ncbi:hypothetical protein EVAR_12252_1 [Eumeta japonica]|uniref:Uncharacterized protein n=1 Tax=Eumeta variegata TaxID=151549 RepID=A0A4C1TU71_EUMVA|nr:hypothetical protein EVAR_12252_1 [Eumeta japonica]
MPGNTQDSRGADKQASYQRYSHQHLQPQRIHQCMFKLLSRNKKSDRGRLIERELGDGEGNGPTEFSFTGWNATAAGANRIGPFFCDSSLQYGSATVKCLKYSNT